MEENQDILDESSELELEEDEGDFAAEDDQEDQSEEEQETETPTKKTPLEGIIEKQVEAYVDAETEEERKAILKKYPKASAQIKRIAENVLEQLGGDNTSKKADEILEKKAIDTKIEKMIKEGGIKGEKNISKMKNAALKLIEEDFSPTQAVKAVLSARGVKSQPAPIRSRATPQNTEKRKSLFTTGESLDDHLKSLRK